MGFRVSTFACVVLCFFMEASLLAQEKKAADPVSGTWVGDWGPAPRDRNEVTLALKWDGKALTGNVTSGENVTSAIPLQKTTFDPKTGAVHMEADARSRGGVIVHFIIDGKVDKDTMTGTWNHDSRKGDFKLTRGTVTFHEPPGHR